MENIFAVFIGGGLGAVVRYLITLLIPSKIELYPVATLCANFLGCFIAAVVFSYFMIKNDSESVHKTFLIVGFCGGLSTLSALSLEVLEYFQTGQYFKAGGYIFTSLLICAISVILGVVLVRKYV